MKRNSTVVRLREPEAIDDPLTAVLRRGARRLLAQAIEAEAEAFLALMKGVSNCRTGATGWCGTAMLRSAWLRPGSVRSRCSGSSCATAAPAKGMTAFASPGIGVDAADPEPGCGVANPLPARGLDG